MQQMNLAVATSQVVTASLIGDGNTVFSGLAVDSRRVQKGDLFFCISGTADDGHRYAPQAIEAGAAALVVERELEINIPQLIVKDARHALAVLSNAYYKHPSQDLRLIGVTGTNGKTTVTYLIEKILTDARTSTGVIGTIEMRYANETYSMSGTTPNAYELQHALRDMADKGVQACAMEVSSHALEQGRVKGCRFRTAVFTNLTQDHLDYHGTMEAYREAKGLFFSRLGNTFAEKEQDRSYAVLNADDQATAYFKSITTAETVTYGLHESADIRAENIRITAQGTSFTVHTFKGSANIQLKMVGKFNVYNALAAIAVGLLEHIELADLVKSLEAVEGVAGRVEAVQAGQSFSVIVDYAHTPDGLENVLSTVKEFAEGHVYCVFGCGGDRDRKKRPIMGQIAAKYADYIYVTSDNPRTEDPDLILLDIEEGLKVDRVPKERYELIVDRRAAITKAIEKASPRDVVLIAGKGHETYQLIGKEIHDFDDRKVAEEAIRGLNR
ncbi:UDP-N-acetylmuramoyl-L-alanyl-D-glutamate--2,6-diaminopimelate ligase [Paenibacillus sp. UMB4589-SE434]|uniref:UDP-N-acetylmuramoyl-L-alanyl-D-glutamate--2, 6-diaminopimelate ligase n=1 Tax=Paenibacillus sp. UMB4589-SE434 TaxID=3046314 RepID=UPI00254FA410|nr:UDP-N-acetylmuramoyl-L-alanyl-D-glutamate--2,6-diaminopimelate ligase [Paenibacillus sp. UMB4589-SE434]MDK8180944.1 UDP-N-acetylmuramoyl-L-alanyl-D-glutamate--2,6-diaminopimelate ligase [Paenibacillus sp. UMB4589-SE434]